MSGSSAAGPTLGSAGADPASHARHQRKAVLAIQQVFATPAVLSLQEVPNQTALDELASAASTTDTRYRSYSSNASTTNSRLGFLVDTRAVSVLRFEQRGEEETFTDADGSASHPVWQHPPLVLQVTPRTGELADALTLINVFLTPEKESAESIIAVDDSEGRRQQVRSLTALVAEYKKRGEQVLVLGNFNTPDSNNEAPGVLDLLTGSYAGEEQAQTDVLSPLLRDLSSTLAEEVRYNAFKGGHPVVLERILVPAGLPVTVQQPHFTAGLPPDPMQMEDSPAGLGQHDGQIATVLMSTPRRSTGTPALFSGDFGDEVIGITSAPQSLSFKADATNTDPVIFQPATITGADSSDFAVTGDTCGTLQPGQQCVVTLTFTPSATGARSATLNLPNNSANESNYTLQISGTGTDLTAALTPATFDFGTVVVGEHSQVTPFTWTNTSPVPLQITAVAIAQSASPSNFSLAGTTCSGTIASGSACTANVVFAPSSPGPQAASLIVRSTATGTYMTLHSALTGTGVSPLTVTPTALNFGNVDVMAHSASQTVTFTNRSSQAISLTPISTTGDFIATSTCGASLPATSSCTVSLVFAPTIAGVRTGALTLASSGGSASVTLAGTGVDFSITIAPASGSLIAGDGISPVVTLTPTPGFGNTVSLRCTTDAAASQCVPESASISLITAMSTPLNIGTISKYIIIGFGGSALDRRSALLAFCSTLVFFSARHRPSALRAITGVTSLFATLTLAGCGSRQPPQNSPYTAPGTYTYTVTATDGILTHAVSYTLQVKAF